MLTETFNENTNDKHVKLSSETLDGKGTNNLSDSIPEVHHASESSVDSEDLIDITIGGKRENQEISRNDDNDYSKTDTNGTKRILIPDETSSSSSSSESSSNDFSKARKVSFAKSSASESTSKDEESDVSHESSKSFGERKNPKISRSANDDYSKTDTNGNKSILVLDETSSSSPSSSTSNDFSKARKVSFAKSSASESTSKDEESDVSHESSKSFGERKNPKISRSANDDYSKTDTNGNKSILVLDETSSSSPSSSTSNDFSKVRKVSFAESSASQIASKGEESDVFRESSKSIGGERENPKISRSANNDYSKTDTNGTKSILVPDEISSSSSSLDSSSNDFLQARKFDFATSLTSESALKDGKSDVSLESSIKSEPGNSSPVPTSTSPIYSFKDGHMSMSPTIAPPVQMMDRSSEYDSGRIPSSVFATNADPTDWTNDSDESLFSIQIGNISLARDHLFTAHELSKSGDLTKSGELNIFSPLPSVLAEGRDTCRKSVEMEDSQKTDMSDEDVKSEESLSKNKNKVKNSQPAISYNSHGNGTGAHLSALPIEKKQTWPLCYCFSCSWAFRCFKLPSFSFLKCCWVLCCCWHASPVSPEAEGLNSVETDSPQQQSSNKSSEVTSDSTSNCCNLCQCFSWLCCSCCCSRTDGASQQSYNKASEKTSSSASNCCCRLQCCSWSCCSCGKCCSWTDSPQQQSHDEASEKTSSSTSSCCSWFQCCFGSCCSFGRCSSCSLTYSPHQQSYDKDSERTSSSTSNCCSCFQCFSGSCCLWGICFYCSRTDSPRQQSFNKASEKTSSSTSNCCSWFLCCSGSCFSWGKCCCCCC